jgi:hypothetical protein
MHPKHLENCIEEKVKLERAHGGCLGAGGR